LEVAVANFAKDAWLYDLGSARGIWVDGGAVPGPAVLAGVHRVTVRRIEVEFGAHADLLVYAGLQGTRRTPWG